jgi:D-alanyl-D-alanine carboxypeptidase
MKHIIKRHRLSIGVIAITTISLSGVLYLHHQDILAYIAQTEQASAAEAAQMDKTIKQILERRAAVLKVAQDAAAKETADQSKTATAATAVIIDSASCNTATSNKDPTAINVVINKKHCLQPVTYTPSDLVSIGNGFVLSAKASAAFYALMDAAQQAGQPLSVTSSYRSYSSQVATYAYWVNNSGAVEADTYSARPGYSEHQTGLAFDVADANKQYVLSNFKLSSQYRWLLAHAAEYGFIQRYHDGFESITGYMAEEWHYRYVGVETAREMSAKNIKTLEQYWGIPGGTYY